MRKKKIFLGGYINHINAQNINCRSIAKHLDKEKYIIKTLVLGSENITRVSRVSYIRVSTFLYSVSNLIAFLRAVLWADVCYVPKHQSTPKIALKIASLVGTKIFTTIEGNMCDTSKRNMINSFGSLDNMKRYFSLIPNVFGAFGSPFYNSFISTFSHQLVNNESPVIIKDLDVKLIYIDELISDIIYIIDNPVNNHFLQIKHTENKKVSEVLELLKSFKVMYIDNGQIPKVELNSFELNLFNSFRSHIPNTYFPRNFTKHKDDRGFFVELVRASTSGQSSYSTTFPGITRGDHYHTRKIERFIVIRGKACIKMRKVNSDEVVEYNLDGETPSYVDIPVWYTHNITNVGGSELITLFWINEPYNEEDSDTYSMKVSS